MVVVVLKSGRMEAFSDGVLAIIITIMVLEMKPPEIIDKASIQQLIPTIISYMLSFIYVGIYWNNHHHLVQKLKYIKGPILWNNLHWLFWMSLIPFSTGWIGMSPSETVPAFFYGLILLFCSISYLLLQNSVVKSEGKNSALAKQIGYDWKGKSSMLLYLLGITAAFWLPAISYSLYLLVALIWFIPDTRIEKTIELE